jgi:KDO2-lipid IV(A) lauroyltransferase
MEPSSRFLYLLTFAPIFVFLKLARILPFRLRVALGGQLIGVATRFTPSVRDRILDNLSLIHPEMSPREARAFCHAVGRQLGRTLTEILFGVEHQAKHLPFKVTGSGLDQIREAKANGRPVLLVSAHFGQWDAARIFLRESEGIEVGALYRPLNNPYYEPFWVAGIKASGEPLIPKGRDGFKDFLMQIRQGKTMALLSDQYQWNGVPLPFLGQDAMTTLTAAELALKFDALLVPVFCIRHDADDYIEVAFHAPIEPTTPEAMLAEFNDLASARIEANPDQWLWPHRRWKP